MRNRAEISARQISAFDGTTLRSYDRFLKRPRKALHSIFESAARVTGSVRFISGHERLPNDALLLTEIHLKLLFSLGNAERPCRSLTFRSGPTGRRHDWRTRCRRSRIASFADATL